MDTIFYFTGTGNCLMIAKKLAECLDNPKLYRITSDDSFPKEVVNGRIIIIYPVYCGNAPNAVLDFVESLQLSEDSFVYSIATHGGHAVIAGPQIAKILNGKNFGNYKLFDIEMIHNGAFITVPPNESGIRDKLNEAYHKVKEIGEMILSNPKEPLLNATDIINEISNNPMAKKVVFSFNPSKMKDDFFLSGKCIHCGICKDVCPMSCISLKDDGPFRSDKCQLCLACLQYCPEGIIQYVHNNVEEHSSVGRPRYQNPDVSLAEIKAKPSFNDGIAADDESGNSTHTIFYFTGTGNCMDVAKRLAQGFNEDVKLIRVCKDTLPLAKKEYSGKIGIVYPTYSNNMPIMLKNFLEELNLKSDSDNYIYSVLVHGGMPGRCHVFINSIMKRKGAMLNASFNVRLPHNGVVLFDSEPTEKQDIWFSGLKARTQEIIDAVNAETTVTAESTMPGKKAALKLGLKMPPGGFKLSDEQDAPNFLFDPQRTEAKFSADDNCIGCGTCEKVCPANNITIENHKPVWNGHCESCMACISLCPNASIQCGDDTKARKRYHNPNIALKDITLR